MATNFFSIHDEFDGARLKPQTINVTKAANNFHPVLKHAAKCVSNKRGCWTVLLANTWGLRSLLIKLQNLESTKLRCFPLRKKQQIVSVIVWPAAPRSGPTFVRDNWKKEEKENKTLPPPVFTVLGKLSIFPKHDNMAIVISGMQTIFALASIKAPDDLGSDSIVLLYKTLKIKSCKHHLQTSMVLILEKWNKQTNNKKRGSSLSKLMQKKKKNLGNCHVTSSGFPGNLAVLMTCGWKASVLNFPPQPTRWTWMSSSRWNAGRLGR